MGSEVKRLQAALVAEASAEGTWALSAGLLTVVEPKAELKNRGLKVGGRKSELVGRLWTDVEEGKEDAARGGRKKKTKNRGSVCFFVLEVLRFQP